MQHRVNIDSCIIIFRSLSKKFFIIKAFCFGLFYHYLTMFSYLARPTRDNSFELEVPGMHYGDMARIHVQEVLGK